MPEERRYEDVVDPFTEGKRILQGAIEKYKPSEVFALFSGGHDSLSVTHWAMNNGATKVAHINTGIGVPETREFVRDTCKREGWELLEYHPPITYRELVLKYGFPGPGAHRYMYTYLKERCVRQLVKEHKRSYFDKVLLVTGVRQEESRRRMGTTEEIQTNGAQVWVAPFIYVTKLQINKYLATNNIPRNPVVDTIHMSGECLCGAYAKKGELKELELWYPHVADEIKSLEKEVARAGFNWRWEDNPTAKMKRKATKHFQPLCHDCNLRGGEDG